MTFTLTRSRLLLWGQKWQAYIPPYSPAGLVNGHALLRFPITGGCASSDATAGSTHTTLAELSTHWTSLEWRPSSAPVEVVWNANEAQPFHSITPSSPADVRRCTEYLLRSACAMRLERSTSASPTSPLSAPAVQDKTCNVDCLADKGNYSSSSSHLATAPSTSASFDAPVDVADTLRALVEVVRQHRHLLAGAESLQTGVPLRFLLHELEDAVLYLQWSRQTRCARSEDTDEKTADSVGSFELEPHVDEADNMKSPISPSTEGATCGEPPAKSGVDPSREDAQRRTAESRKTLQEEFHSEVASFQHQLRRRGKVAASKIPDSPSNNEPACTAYAGFTSSSFNERAAAHTTYANVSQLPLVTVLTSTHSSLASALRATAVAWAVGGSEHWTIAGATHVLWRPAPETALAAAWMVVLLRRHAHEQETRRRLNADAGTADDVTPLAAAKTERATAAGAADATPAGPHIEVQETEKESSTLSSVSSSPGFHVLLTGGDTEVNFVAPYLEGVAHASRLHEVTSRVSHVVAFHGAGSKEGRRTGAPFLGGDNGVESPVLLCYGCPAAQVRDLRCFLARQHKRQPSEPETSNIVAELRTEVATTGIVMSDAIAELSAAAPIGQQTVAAEKKDALDRAPSTAPFTTAQTSCVDPATCAQGGSQKRPTSAAGRSPSWEAPFRAVPSRDTTLRTISSVFEPVPSCESACAAVMVPRGGLTEVANEVFRRSVVEPPFLRSSRDTSPSLFAAANTSTATTANRTNEGKQSALFESVSLPSPSTIPGWCSLCFVAEQHTAPLLRSLVQRHWKEPWYIGHSLDGSSRRGPAPSSAHTQGIQDVLRCATNGTDVCEGATLCLKHRIADDDAAAPPHFRQAICWRHGCGGFSLPLTATAGRGSSYTLPCLLVTDLEAAMTEGEQHDLLLYRASGLTDGRTRRGNGAASPPDHSAATSSLSLSASPLNAVGAAPLRSRQEGDDTHDLDTRVKRAAQRATRAIQRNVAGLVEMYDARQLGYRGVVAGNFLFLCRYPAAVEDAVVAAVLEGVTAR